MIDKRAVQERVVAGGESGGDAAGIGATFGGGQAIEFGRQDFPRGRRGDLKIRDEQDESQIWRDLEARDFRPPATVKPPNAAGAALSGCPSSSAQILKRA